MKRRKKIIRYALVICLCLCTVLGLCSKVDASPIKEVVASERKLGEYPNFYCGAYDSSVNPFAQSNYYGQCTWYVWGRAYELTGKKLPQRGSAYTWGNGQTISSVPRSNSIAVWTGGYGHVAYVEAVNGNNVTISEANCALYGGSITYNQLYSLQDGIKYYSGMHTETLSSLQNRGGQQLLGFIYLETNSTTSTISVGTGDATDITETNAVVRGVVNKTSNITSGIRVGVRIGTSSNNFNIKSSYLEDVVSGAYSQNNGTNFPMWFNINNELGVTLKKGTTYYYQMMATYGGKTYYGEVKSFRTAGDGTAPVISNVKVSNVTNKGYTVSCTVTDNVGVAKVQFPTWTLKNDQDDLIKDWGSNAKASGTKNGSTYTYQVKISDHNNETGMYTTHIYAYDSAGNYSSKEVGNINVDGTSPTVNKIESFDVKNDRFSVKCTASDNVGVTKINYYCWGEGDAWDKGGICKQTTATNGTSSTTITLKDLNKTKGGYYYIDVLAYDAAGNVSATKGISVYVDQTLPTLSNIKVYDITETGYTVSCTATDNAGIARVQFPTWTGKDWQDDLLKDWSTNTKLKGAANGSTYTFRVNTSEHNNEYGVYITHIYAYDKAGNYTMYKTIQVTVEPASDGGGGTSSQGTSDGSTTEIEDQDNTDVQDNTELSPQEKEKIKVIKKKKATISSLKNKKGKKVVVTIKKVKYADGYEIKYSTNSKFKKNVKKVQTKSVKKTLKKLKKGKTYYVKVRPYYKDSSGKITYGKYGKVKKVKIKK